MIFTKMTVFKKIINSGIQYTSAKSEKRNIMLSNYISIIIALAGILLLITRLIADRSGPEANFLLAGTSLLLLVPLVLNNAGLTTVSRFFLCWVPGLCAVFIAAVIIKTGGKVETSDFIGHRFYLLVLACTPFLIFNVKRPGILIIALTGSIIPLMFYDTILSFFHIGYYDQGLTDSSYAFNLFRISVTYFILGLSFYFLKRIVENQEVENEKLFKELELRNEFIQRDAHDELYQLNAQLKLNFQQLSEREFILNQSQRIAKIASWEYYLQNSLLVWSDEMYAIFGLEKNFTPKAENMLEALGVEGGEMISNATRELLKTNQPFDTIIRTKTPLGYTKWFRIYVFPIPEGGRTIGIRGICHDITYFKEAEEKLKSSEAKFSKVFETYPDFIMVERESDLLVVDVNQRIVNVLGFQKEEVIGRSARSMDLFLTEKARQKYINEYTLEGFTEHETSWKRKDGRIIQVEITGIRVDIEGQYYRMSVVRDITKTRLVEREKELAQANLKATINNTEVLIWSVDRRFNLITFNTPFLEFIRKNFATDVKVGSNLFDLLLSPSDQELRNMWIQHYTRALAGEVVTLEETTFGIDFQYSLSPIIEENMITGVSVFADNVTELNISYRELAEANKKISELKLMALRSVMSPHFIFNVLNSIQFFITKNDRLNAITYLSTFSKLIRSVLTHSISNKIMLSDEIELLKNYILLELTRFENKFDLILNVNPEIEASSTELPSLLIQPYVENAILHGLYNKPEKGTLQINIDKDNDHIIFVIEDNGIGREEAMKLREKNFPTHKSMGLKVTEERLKLINQQNVAAFEIEDLEHEGKPAGTRVTIKIAIE